ncbi:glutaminyl-peptide cyclotransferase [Parapedobacter koreensis]|uniref:Glutamine cyclotransferase n=1 Tax=Parapedobacter koreensis TaxID=332977 RepID=A0A1H7TTT7_9SPHI|nr:glutaminyl-peptide cyclotransferase [Parapedobacter koreensis]SEL88063.1 Glutamine cyclotransferase [Parapedobacter koreensis]
MLKNRKTFNQLACGILLLSLVMGACTNPSNVRENSVPERNVPSPHLIRYSVVDKITHDTTAFTQGLVVYNGDLLEGTGQQKRTLIRTIDTLTGKAKTLYSTYRNDIFGEGITVLGEKLYQLTYQNHVVYVFDIKNFSEFEKTFTWQREGWGCTTDSTSIILSDGTASLFFVNPNSFNVEREITVVDDKGPVVDLNELEYIDGYVYANRWHSDTIYKIDPHTGHVVGLMHIDGLIQRYKPDFIDTGENVLNGIAWDQRNKTLFITGKNWPTIFKIKFTPM